MLRLENKVSKQIGIDFFIEHHKSFFLQLFHFGMCLVVATSFFALHSLLVFAFVEFLKLGVLQQLFNKRF
jgi:hypothetical protein